MSASFEKYQQRKLISSYFSVVLSIALVLFLLGLLGMLVLNAKKVLAQLKSDNADEATGIQIINKAVEAPLRTIVENSGGEGSVVVSKVSEGKNNFGYNAKEGTYVDMLKEGIIDPKKVTRVALENAASVSGMILTTECALIDIKEEAPAPPPMGGGMPGMM